MYSWARGAARRGVHNRSEIQRRHIIDGRTGARWQELAEIFNSVKTPQYSIYDPLTSYEV